MYIIIGNSIAAISAVEKIRENDKDVEITMISDEPYHSYSRPMIPGYVYGDYDDDKILLRDKDFYEKNNIKTLFGKKVVSVIKEQVVLEGGKTMGFSKLLIATGGIPFIPSIKGYDKDVLSFTTLDDAKKIKKSDGNSYLVIGAGLIGLKAAESLVKLGKKVVVVELADRVLSAITDEESSKIFLKLIKEKGIDLIFETTVDEILRKDGKIIGAKLSDGNNIECDSVMIAIGVRPNIEIVKGSSIEVNKGIIVNEFMETNVKNIYAAGDCSEAYDIIFDEKRNLALWPNASLQGKIAGLNMAGVKEEYPGSYMMNSISFFDLPIMSYGMINSDGCEVLQNNDKDDYKKIVIKDDKVVGAVFVNDIDRAGIINGLIRDKIDVSSFKDLLLNESLSLVYLPKKLRDEKIQTVPKVRL